MNNEEIIKAHIAEQEKLKLQQKMQLRASLNTFTLKELKKEIIKMKADNFTVKRMKRKRQAKPKTDIVPAASIKMTPDLLAMINKSND